MIVLFGVKRQQPHQMQGIGVIGVDGERLLAAKLRVEIPSFAAMTNARLMQRGGRGCARALWPGL